MFDHTKAAAQSRHSSPKTPDRTGEAFGELLHELIVISGIGIHEYGRQWLARPLSAAAVTFGLFWLAHMFVRQHLLEGFIIAMSPENLAGAAAGWLTSFSNFERSLAWFALFLAVTVFLLGFAARMRQTWYYRIFDRAGLAPQGKAPTLVRRKKLGHKRSMLEFDSRGIGLGRFRDRSEDLEAGFNRKIETIEAGNKPKFVRLILTENRLPSTVSYEELTKKQVLPEGSFYIGQSNAGVLYQSISTLPHMLITGSTGNGKSTFFKQMLMGMLESTPRLQLYLLDLKQGLEMADFRSAPNVVVVKTMSDAVAMLERIHEEMKARFRYLEESNKKLIIPEKDDRDRIVVAVDECSVLYQKRPKFDPDQQAALKARLLTDGLAKLSRAAAIHLVLATQKLSAEVLPTSVTENIAGRMCFRTETLQGSLMVLGNKSALNLPDIKGRGIWNFGSKQMLVQAPLISSSSIERRCKVLADAYNNTPAAKRHKLLGISEKRKANQAARRLQDTVKSGRAL